MINLLPPRYKESIEFSKKNTRFLKWLFALFLGLVGLVAVILAGQVYIQRTYSLYEKDSEQTAKRLEAQNLEQTQQRVKELSSNVNLVIDVLSEEVLFSKLFQHVGSIMPPGTALQNLSFSEFKGAIDLTAIATDYDTATQVQVNLSDEASKIFEKVDIVNTSCREIDPDAATPDLYPCLITVKALFAKDNPFLFLSNEGGEL